MKLEGKRKKIMDAIVNGSNNYESISSKTKIELRIVKNVIMELYDAQLIRKTEDGVITVRVKPIKPIVENTTGWRLDDDCIEDGKLKNLARTV